MHCSMRTLMVQYRCVAQQARTFACLHPVTSMLSIHLPGTPADPQVHTPSLHYVTLTKSVDQDYVRVETHTCRYGCYLVWCNVLVIVPGN